MTDEHLHTLTEPSIFDNYSEYTYACSFERDQQNLAVYESIRCLFQCIYKYLLDDNSTIVDQDVAKFGLRINEKKKGILNWNMSQIGATGRNGLVREGLNSNVKTISPQVLYQRSELPPVTWTILSCESK